MDITGAIYQRHSVRQYLDKPLEEEKIAALNIIIDECNKEGGLNIQLVTNEERAFKSFLARYGSFKGVKNYIALVGKKGDKLNEKLGYYGEKIVLEAQTMGLNTCWAALTYKKVKGAYKVAEGEKLGLVIAVGYGQNQGKPHKNKLSVLDLCPQADPPEWFMRGAEAALLAPTALNQQKFMFTQVGERGVRAVRGRGAYTDVDLGIVKYHFEAAAGKQNFDWVD